MKHHWVNWWVITFIGGFLPMLIRLAVWFLIDSDIDLIDKHKFSLEHIIVLGLVMNLSSIFELVKPSHETSRTYYVFWGGCAFFTLALTVLFVNFTIHELIDNYPISINALYLYSIIATTISFFISIRCVKIFN